MTTPQPAVDSPPLADERIYDRSFWLAYAANVSLVTANALTFRFAELVKYLGGTEQTAGEIVSAGMIGALAARFLLGQAIDRYGTRKVWPLASLLFLCACGIFLACNQLSLLLYVARVAFAVGLAGMFTCSMVHIQNQVPHDRRTEAIASLGSSGFFGMIAGTQLGDLIFGLVPPGRGQFIALFGLAGQLGLFYLAAIMRISRREAHVPPHETPAAHQLVLRYWPGNVVLVAAMIGIAFAVTSVFLTRFSTERNLGGIGVFFTVFSIAAFFLRVASRRWSRVIGRHRMILIGLVGQCIGLAMLPLMTRGWHLVFPAIGCGFGHALLFPAVMSLGTGTFPKEYRGSGTTIMLGFSEVGTMLSAPLLGWLIVQFDFTHMFLFAAALSLGVGVVYYLTDAQRADDDIVAARPERAQLQPAGEAAGATADSAAPVCSAASSGTVAASATADADSSDSVPVPFPNLGRSA